MSIDQWEFGAAVPENYERYLVPILFDPYAQAMAEQVARTLDQAGSGEMLEIACGTGALTRRLCAALPKGCTIVATDLSPEMVKVGQSRRPGDDRLTWQTADAADLPFANGRFQSVVCQFGLMFLPEPRRALEEARRVLCAGGRLFLSVWDSAAKNPHAQIFQEVALRFAPQAVLDDFARPFSMSDPLALAELVESSGFEQVVLEVVQLDVEAKNACDWARGAILGTPRGAQFRAAGVDLEAVVQALGEQFVRRGGSAPCRMQAQAILVTAVAG